MIRELTLQDLSGINAINFPFYYEGHYQDVALGNAKHYTNWVTSWILRDTSYPYGYFIDGELAGYVILDIAHTMYDRPSGSINHLIIDKKHRNKGIADKLIEHVLEICDNHLCIEVYAASTGIQTERQDRLFVRMMRKHGFKPYSTLLKRE